MKSELGINKILIIIGLLMIISFVLGIQSYTAKLSPQMRYKVLNIKNHICDNPTAYVIDSSHNISEVLDEPYKYSLRIATYNEKILVCLGKYSNILEEKTWKEDNVKVVVFRVQKGGSNKCLLMDSHDDTEVYVMITNSSGEFLVPLIKIIDPERIIEFKGSVTFTNLTEVKIYAFPVSVEFNKTHTPSENFYLTSAKVYNGKFWIRLDSKLIPVRFKGSNMPNQWILIYGLPCKGGYRWYKIGESIGKTIYVNLTHEENENS